MAPTPSDDRLRALRSLPEMAPFNDAELRSLLPYFDEVTVDAGSLLATRGRPSSEYLVVLEGRLEARCADGSRSLRAGSSSGWQAMWRRGCADATLQAASAARLLVMGRAQFRAVTALAARKGSSRSMMGLDGCARPAEVGVAAGSAAGTH